MRSRTLHFSFFMDEELGALPPAARLLFQGMWCLADREGRLQDRPGRISAQVLPYDSDEDGIEHIDRLARAGFIIRYEVDGERYIQVRSFAKYQTPHPREKASEIPAQDGTMPAAVVDPYGPTWPAARAAALALDEFTCRRCASTDSIEVHHITPARLFVDRAKAHAIENLITLCRPCHALVHASMRAEAAGTQP